MEHIEKKKYRVPILFFFFSTPMYIFFIFPLGHNENRTKLTFQVLVNAMDDGTKKVKGKSEKNDIK